GSAPLCRRRSGSAANRCHHPLAPAPLPLWLRRHPPPPSPLGLRPHPSPPSVAAIRAPSPPPLDGEGRRRLQRRREGRSQRRRIRAQRRPLFACNSRGDNIRATATTQTTAVVAHDDNLNNGDLDDDPGREGGGRAAPNPCRRPNPREVVRLAKSGRGGYRAEVESSRRRRPRLAPTQTTTAVVGDDDLGKHS
ncbi:Os05g0256033, partial [Oryza sativa Japonica Group]